MTRTAVNRISFLVPLIFSALAFALVIGNILAGVKPSPDEGTSAHLFQLLIGLQAPFILAFVATSGPSLRPAVARFALLFLAMASAFMPVWLAGY